MIANLTLIGFMGTGKTSVGRVCAEQAGWSFIDCDAELERRLNRIIKDIFREHGEGYFRSAEAETLDQILKNSHQVISTGGGIVTYEPSRRMLLESKGKGNKIIWLKAAPEVIYERTACSQDRPLLNVADPLAEIRRLLMQRHMFYEQLADACIDTTALSIEQTADAVLRLIE
ncbi:MAG TPA: shikimate kinase [Firmicutes bacterium]|jgi:shikimate kinase|nr:shikimate kinase [Bacillota bacterium]